MGLRERENYFDTVHICIRLTDREIAIKFTLCLATRGKKRVTKIGAETGEHAPNNLVGDTVRNVPSNILSYNL